jgi:hypothetical protein
MLSISTFHSSVQASILANLNVSCQSQSIITQLRLKGEKELKRKRDQIEKRITKKAKKKRKERKQVKCVKNDKSYEKKIEVGEQKESK